ncbi:hypothetical protein V6N13_014226 [Hibiscus sabdariffa]
MFLAKKEGTELARQSSDLKGFNFDKEAVKGV